MQKRKMNENEFYTSLLSHLPIASKYANNLSWSLWLTHNWNSTLGQCLCRPISSTKCRITTASFWLKLPSLVAVTNSSAANLESTQNMKHMENYPILLHWRCRPQTPTVFVIYSFLYFWNFLARNEQLFLLLVRTLRNRTRVTFCHCDIKINIIFLSIQT